MQPNQKIIKPANSVRPLSGIGGDGIDDNQAHDGMVSPKFAIRTGNEGVIILSQSAQQSGQAQSIPEATRGEKVGLQTLVNEGPSAGYNLPPLDPSHHDTPLGIIANKFVDLIQHAEDGTLNVTEAANTLNVEETLIYSVATILEAAGLIEMTHDNPISWKYVDVSTPEEVSLQGEIANLNMKEHDLDWRIREMQDKFKVLSEDDNNKRWHFLREEDLKSLPCIQNKMLFVVNAPRGTTIETPDPNEWGDHPPRRNRLIFRSTSGDINLYLISEHEEILQLNPGQEASVIQEPLPVDVRGNEEISAQRIEAPDYNIFDDDSWLLSDMDAGITDTGTEPEIDWDRFHAWVANQNASAPLPLNDARENEINPRTEAQKICSNASTSQDTATVITKNMPDYNIDADYWLLSNDEPSISDMWTEHEVNLPSLDEALADKMPSEDDTKRS